MSIQHRISYDIRQITVRIDDLHISSSCSKIMLKKLPLPLVNNYSLVFLCIHTQKHICQYFALFQNYLKYAQFIHTGSLPLMSNFRFISVEPELVPLYKKSPILPSWSTVSLTYSRGLWDWKIHKSRKTIGECYSRILWALVHPTLSDILYSVWIVNFKYINKREIEE